VGQERTGIVVVKWTSKRDVDRDLQKFQRTQKLPSQMLLYMFYQNCIINVYAIR
jgi:hypothetical protein